MSKNTANNYVSSVRKFLVWMEDRREDFNADEMMDPFGESCIGVPNPIQFRWTL